MAPKLSAAQIEQTLQDVLELGRLPREFKNPATDTEVAEQRLARKIRRQHLRERAQQRLDEFKATKDTTNGSSSSAANGCAFTTSGDSHPAANLLGGCAQTAVEQILQGVLEFGRLPKEFNNPATETEAVEQRLARRVRKHQLRKRAQERLEELKLTKDAANANSSPAANGYPFTISGDSHPAQQPARRRRTTKGADAVC